MFSTKISTSRTGISGGPVPICPNCGGGDHEDNRIDETLYREAAREAPRLRHEGHNDEAIKVLTALAASQIVNFMRHEWLCLCGATFDA